METGRRVSAAVLFAGACLLAVLFPPAIAAGDDAGLSVLPSLARFFGAGDPVPEPLRRGLLAFEEGHFEEAERAVQPIVSGGEPAHAADDARFLQALAMLGLGRVDASRGRLRELLDSGEPGPYYVPALLALVELEERSGRDEEVAALWSRHVDRPLRSRDPRGERVSELLFEFGTLRAPRRGLSRDEKRLLSKPEELEVVLEKRRERTADRLAYRAGLALQRLGRFRESLDAFLLVGVTSPYWPYARYSTAQNLYALGENGEALRTLRRLEHYPAPTPDEELLRNRARLLRAAVTIEGGELEEGIGLAGSIPDEDPAAAPARILIAETLVTAGKPALAVVYDETGSGTDAGPALVAARSLAVGSAYASLGDLAAAERLVKGAATRVRDSRIDEAVIARAVERLADRARRAVRSRLTRERMERAHVAGGMAEILAHDGPWGFLTMLRRIRAVLGAGAHVRLAGGVKAEPRDLPAGDDLWLAFLRSPRRRVVEDALARLETPDASGDPDAASRLRARIDDELRSVVRERNAELSRLSLDLEVALADTLAGQAGIASLAAEAR